MYIDDSFYENELHYRLAKLDEELNKSENGKLVIKCNDEKSYNKVLDDLCNFGKGKFEVFCTSIEPLDVVIEKDPRDSYRKFDEKYLMKESDKIE